MIFFTSDTHFYHRRIIEYCRRPFGSVEVMNEELIRKWNEKVRPEDVVYHLGDLAFSSIGNLKGTLAQLNGRIKLVRGNHDRRNLTLRPEDEILGHYHEELIAGRLVVLCHYPLLTWRGSGRGSWMLHGHSHGGVDAKNAGTTRLDVGVDGIAQYAPLSLDEVADIMRARKYEPVDHHGIEP